MSICLYRASLNVTANGSTIVMILKNWYLTACHFNIIYAANTNQATINQIEIYFGPAFSPTAMQIDRMLTPGNPVLYNDNNLRTWPKGLLITANTSATLQWSLATTGRIVANIELYGDIYATP